MVILKLRKKMFFFKCYLLWIFLIRLIFYCFFFIGIFNLGEREKGGGRGMSG